MIAGSPAIAASGPKQWRASASHNQKDVGLAIDTDAGSRWSSDAQQEPGMWFAIDMLNPTQITKLTLDTQRSAEDFPLSYDVSISDDGVTWSAPIIRNTGKNATIEIPLPPGTVARHVRITQTGKSQRWWSIHELITDTKAVSESSQ